MGISIVNAYLDLMVPLVKMVELFFLFFLFCKITSIVFVTLDSNEQAILVDWYNTLTSKGKLDWNVSNDLCTQTGITCDYSTPRRVKEMYFLSSFPFSLNKSIKFQSTNTLI